MRAWTGDVRTSRSPLTAKFADHLFRGEVEVNLRGREPIMAEDLLQSSRGDALMNARHRERMPQDMGGDGSADMRTIRHLLDHPLDGSNHDREAVMEG